MKIKYNLATGEITAWGAFTNILPSQGEAVEDTDSTEDLVGKIRLSANSYRTKTKQETDAGYETSPKKRLDDLKKKNVLSLEEVTEVLKLRGLL